MEGNQPLDPQAGAAPILLPKARHPWHGGRSQAGHIKSQASGAPILGMLLILPSLSMPLA